MPRRATAVVLGSLVTGMSLAGCAVEDRLDACSPRVPVAVVAQTIREQASLVGDTEASRLVGSLGDTLEILATAATEAPGDVAAAIDLVSVSLGDLSEALIAVDFDLVVAVGNPEVSSAMDVLESDAVAEANLLMESYMFSLCGPDSLLLDDPSVVTLPTPTVLVPEQDEPLSSLPEVDTAGDALARIVAEQFGLTLDAEQLACLGDRLADAPDPGEDATAEDLDRLFVRLFRSCGIDVTLP
jgi:hypothetical protein